MALATRPDDLRTLDPLSRRLRKLGRLRWLRERPRLWIGYEKPQRNAAQDKEPRKKEIVDGMRAAGLIATGTVLEDINVARMVEDLRRCLREQAEI